MDLVVDLEGYFAPETVASTAGSVVPLTPDRTLDTRPASVTGPTNQGSGQTLGAGTNLAVQVLGDGGVPATDVTAVEVKATATDSTSPGLLTVYPGEPFPPHPR